jgi:hypothetical protein
VPFTTFLVSSTFPAGAGPLASGPLTPTNGAGRVSAGEPPADTPPARRKQVTGPGDLPGADLADPAALAVATQFYRWLEEADASARTRRYSSGITRWPTREMAPGQAPSQLSRDSPAQAMIPLESHGQVAGLEPVASSSRTEHPGREMWCVWMFPQLRGSEAGAVTASGRACQCLAAPILLPAGCCQRLAGPPEGHRARPSA